MKRKIGFLLCAVLVMFCMAASADVKIDSKNFPDANFREYVRQFDTDQNGSFSEEEIQNTTAFYYCSNKGIASMKGVEFFTALTSISCNKNQLTELDLSKNTALKTLDCTMNQLTQLKLNSSELVYLVCWSNKLTQLNISKCPKLDQLVREKAPHRILGADIWSRYSDNGETLLMCIQADPDLRMITSADPIIRVTSIKLNKSKATLKKGKSLTLKIKQILPANATDNSVKWTSSNKKIATVDQNGKVKAKKKGTCIITCKAMDGSGVKAVCKITVK